MTTKERIRIICSSNTTQFLQFAALYELRQLIDDVQALDIYCEVDLLLHSNEGSLLECDKDRMRALGYCFPEDLENARELLSRKPDDG